MVSFASPTRTREDSSSASDSPAASESASAAGSQDESEVPPPQDVLSAPKNPTPEEPNSNGTELEGASNSPTNPAPKDATIADPATAKRPKPKTGVVYISRIPPGMDVGALRALLSRTGNLGRVYLRPESAASLAERRSLTTSRRRTEFRDGWAEFTRRRDARRAVELLNGRPMAGAKRRGRWADDLWCIRLLPGFTWADLVQETCAGARERTLRVKAEVAAARREKAFVEERVAMAGRIAEGERRSVRRFRQKRVVGEGAWEEDVDEMRAKEAMERIDEELESGKGRMLDEELVGMLFKRRRKGEAAAGKGEG